MRLLAIRFEDGVRLVKIRGESMQAAADARPSAMVSVIGLSSDKVLIPLKAICAHSARNASLTRVSFDCHG